MTLSQFYLSQFLHNSNFAKPCHDSSGHCDTAPKSGVVFWGSNILFNGKIPCQPREYRRQECLLSSHVLRCPQANLAISSLFSPYKCGEQVAIIRLVLTNNTNNEDLLIQNDFVTVSSEFNLLYEDSKTNYHPNMALIATQIQMCKDPNN
jgi:hypothetical protein